MMGSLSAEESRKAKEFTWIVRTYGWTVRKARGKCILGMRRTTLSKKGPFCACLADDAETSFSWRTDLFK